MICIGMNVLRIYKSYVNVVLSCLLASEGFRTPICTGKGAKPSKGYCSL